MTASFTGRCYCGSIHFHTAEPATSVVYCHCADCRRVSGAPVAAFAEFKESAVILQANTPKKISINPGVTRSFCADCGTPLFGCYDYLPGMIYVSLGLIDQADTLVPSLHAHESNRLAWLTIDDDCKRCAHSVRAKLMTSNNV